MPENLGSYIAAAITVAWFAGILVWIYNRKFGKVKVVKASVVHKQVNEVYSKYSGNGKAYRYYVTFQFNGKRKSFSVSEFSYNGYRKGETGTLKYKGDRLIDFH